MDDILLACTIRRFRLADGVPAPSDEVSTPDARGATYSLASGKGLLRIISRFSDDLGHACDAFLRRDDGRPRRSR